MNAGPVVNITGCFAQYIISINARTHTDQAGTDQDADGEPRILVEIRPQR